MIFSSIDLCCFTDETWVVPRTCKNGIRENIYLITVTNHVSIKYIVNKNLC